MRKGLIRFAAIDFVRKAIEEEADLTAFKEKPSLQVLAGVFLICFSFLLGWPAVALCGIAALKLHEPMIAVIGGPLVYGLSHLVFLLGMYFSGAKFTLIFLRWLSRVTVEKLFALIPPEPS
ncbi:MAG: hypothetical protein KKD01_17165 [Proteobacteria bacterium]|nr:hypothetical protein [Pseudomonadota bacterium]MBU1138611.1 hypothetical protein [Pseudomonadota bacterium]MBU1232716.1 hypothetical protein [Pseudomonadota bacterium]MBU1418452.1 hypothetical protein [Pseudomonadota bacterium]MBU1456456.1 hypothetical protein [Pseudomonadota bacterium]